MGENVQFVNIFGYRHTDVDYYSSVDGLPTLISDGTGAIPAGLPVTVVGGRQKSDVEQFTDEVQFKGKLFDDKLDWRSEQHTSELQSLMRHLVCRLLLEKKKNIHTYHEKYKK